MLNKSKKSFAEIVLLGALGGLIYFIGDHRGYEKAQRDDCVIRNMNTAFNRYSSIVDSPDWRLESAYKYSLDSLSGADRSDPRLVSASVEGREAEKTLDELCSDNPNYDLKEAVFRDL